MAANLTVTGTRGNRPITCSTCGAGNLQWVQTSDGKGGGGWRIVPFGTTDTSGSVHALTTRECAKRQAALAKANGAPVTVEKIVERNVGNADLGPINARVDTIEAGYKGLRDDLDAIAPLITDIADGITTKVEPKLAALEVKISTLDKSRPITITTPNNVNPIDVGRQHDQFPNLVAMAIALQGTGFPFVVGAAGNFKSTAFYALAKALNVGKRYDLFSLGITITEVELMGYIDANGKPVETPLLRRFRDGGLMGFDEFDAVSAAGLLCCNAAISQPEVGFPCGMVKRHNELYYVAFGNTSGRGADMLYNGRSQLDAATLDRACYLPWDTDWKLLAESLGFDPDNVANPRSYPAPSKPRALSEFNDWLAYVNRISAIVSDPSNGIRAIVGPRAVINGKKLLEAGIHTNYQSPASDGLVEYSTIWAHMSPEDALTVKAKL